MSFPLIGSAIQIGIASINTKNFQLMRKLCQKYGSVMGFKARVQNFGRLRFFFHLVLELCNRDKKNFF